MSRSVNKADMTVREIINDLKDGICDYCCKHLEEANLKSKRAHERAKKKKFLGMIMMQKKRLHTTLLKSIAENVL